MLAHYSIDDICLPAFANIYILIIVLLCVLLCALMCLYPR